MKHIFYLLLSFQSFLVFSQDKNREEEVLPAQETVMAPVILHLSINAKDVEETAIALSQLLPNLAQADVSLLTEYVTESPAAMHYTFLQQYKGIPIYEARVKATVPKHNSNSLVTDASFNTQEWKLILPETASNQQVIFVGNELNQPRLAVKRIVYEGEVAVREEVVDNGEVLATRSLVFYAGIDSQLSLKVFNPDPLTMANAPYGGPYIDDNDADNASLTALLETQSITGSFDNGYFKLENAYIRAADFDLPTFASPVLASPQFYYTREQDEFEYVNAFFHLNKMREDIHNLGFTLSDALVEFDAHASNGADNSFFNAANPPRIYLGDGGIDDGEDADVAVHEYGHFISHRAAPGTNTGSERNALDEALGDYMAVSYSRAINDFNWGKVFSWDGNNGNWQGRVANSPKTYPTDLVSSFYKNGEIWSSVLMQIWEELGKTITDKLVFQTYYAMTSGLTLPQAADLLIYADTLLFSGANYCTLYNHLYHRGLQPYLAGNPCGVQPGIAEQQTGNATFVPKPSSFVLTVEEGTRLDRVQVLDLHGAVIGSLIPENKMGMEYQNSLLPRGIYFVVAESNQSSFVFKWSKSH